MNETVNPYSTESFRLEEPAPPAAAESDNGWYTQWVRVSHTEGKGIGYPCGFTTLEALFGPEYVGGKFLPLLDVGFNYFDNNTVGGSVGIIYRYIPTISNWLPGASIYYDFRTIHSKYFNEIGLGVELLGKRFDFYFNGYIPVGATRKFHRRRRNYSGGFSITRTSLGTTLGGFDGGVGIILMQKGGFQIYTAGGPYYLTGKFIHPFWGGKVYLQTDYKDRIALTLSGSRDSFFGTIFQIEVSFSWPLYKDPKVDPPASTRQVYQPVNRNPILPTGSKYCWQNSGF